MNSTPAPAYIAQIGLEPDKFHYSDARSFRGPCPRCNGTRRFVWFIDKEWPLQHGYCDECGLKIKAWEKVRAPITQEQRQAALLAEAQRERERAEYRRAKLAEFSAHELWAELTERMTSQHVEYWETQGIPEGIQKYLQIGYKADKQYYDSEKTLQHSPAYTIPWFAQNFVIQTMQYRLINPVNPKDRYRFEDGLGGGGSYYYAVDPSEPIKERCIICEGAKKGIVCWTWLMPVQCNFSVIAASSNNTLRPALEATKNCAERYLVLDPGSERKALQTQKENPGLRLVFLPEKLDDMYVNFGLDRTGFTDLLKQARM
jgi:hypothetical protein